MYALPTQTASCPPHEVAGTVLSIRGSQVRAEGLVGVALDELVRVGRQGIWGEVVQLETDKARGAAVAVIEAYEETAGIAVGDAVVRTGRPLSVELGPGLLGSVFDGLQRPLDAVRDQQQPQQHADGTGASGWAFVPRGLTLPPLDREWKWWFEPTGDFRIGDAIAAGDLYATVQENALFVHRIALPLDAPGGRIAFIAQPEAYTVTDVVLEVVAETDGRRRQYTMMQTWPVRRRRPIEARRRPERPFLTGLRCLDALFPCAVGGTAALAGGVRWFTSHVTHAMARHARVDVSVYVGCGQRGTDLGEVLMELHETTLLDAGLRQSVMKRTIVVANPANAPRAAREASVDTGLAIAEYLRDQGCDVALTVDSLCRWAHAIGGSTRQQQQPQLGHWDRDGVGRPQLETQLGALCERAGRFVCTGAPAREGTITLVAITADSGMSRPGGAWADVDTITEAAKAVTQTVWAADRSTPFMSIDWRQSRSDLFFGALTGQDPDNYYRRHIADDFVELRRACLDLLQAEADLAPRVAQVGRDRLPEPEKATLYAARLVREDFLYQNFFAPVEARCSLYKAAWMMRNMVLLRSLALATLAANANKNQLNAGEMMTTTTTKTTKTTKKYGTWRELHEAVRDLLYRLGSARFEEFGDGHKFAELGEELREAFAGLGCPIFPPYV